MKKPHFNAPQAAACLLVTGMTLSPAASAHDINSSLLNSNGATAVDVYRVTCFSDPSLGGGASANRFKAAIRDKSAGVGGQMSLTMFRDGLAVNVTDIVGGDLTQSPYIQLNSGNGDYWLFVTHTLAGGDNYYVEYHCETTNGTHTGTSIFQTQNK